jgi:preprotein translocase subunit SecA
MDIQEIISQLEYYDGSFPRKALQEAIASREQITPILLNILEEATANIERLLERDDYMAHIYAMFLLAQFREKRAYPLIVNFFSTPGDIALESTGDVVTEYLRRILASVYDGDDSLIKQMAENESADEFVRGAAVEAMASLVATGQKTREEVLQYYKELLQNESAEKSSYFCAAIVSAASSLYPEEIYDEIKEAFEKDIVDETILDLKFVDRKMAQGKERVLAELQDKRNGLMGNTIEEMEWWAGFREPPQKQVVKKKKVGRNEPCPCGSGKKYKKCCGA